MRHSLAPVAFGISIATLLIPAAAQACSVCMGSSPADYGFFWGILLLMAMPFTVGGLIGGWLFYTYRHGHRDALTTAPVQANGTKPAVWTPLQKESTH